MAMFAKFQQGDMPLFYLNLGTMILPPKKENVIQIHQYRLICFFNVSFQIFTKVSTNHLTGIAEKGD
jgi:hypothetical protein